MIKKVVFSILLLASSLLAQKAVLLEIVSENILKIEYKNEVQKVHLAGIELFSKANGATRSVDISKKEELKKEALAYISRRLKIGGEIRYAVISDDVSGVKKIWLDTEDLNYRMVRDGYALLDASDPFLPTPFKMRMSKAMQYAKDKKFGLWAKEEVTLRALIDRTKHMCGWRDSAKVASITRESILKEQQASVPTSFKVKRQSYFFAMLHKAR